MPACCDRRSFLLRSAVLGAAGASAVSLSACGASEPDTADGPGSAQPGTEPTEDQEGSAWRSLMSADELGVGETARASAAEKGLLLYRADEDQVHVFSDVCTHQGCSVSPRPEAERFECPCHGSVYALEDGVPFGGPAREPLRRFTAEITDGQIRVLL